MKTKDIRLKDDDALVRQERELRDQLFKLRFQLATNQSENPGRVRLARKELARVLTIRGERRRAAAATRPSAAKE